MIDTPLVDHEDIRYQALSKISKLANSLIWVILVIYTALFLLNGVYTFLLLSQNHTFDNLIDYYGLIDLELLTDLLCRFLKSISILVNGMIYALVLKAISVGLDMLMETDLNYINKSQGEIHE